MPPYLINNAGIVGQFGEPDWDRSFGCWTMREYSQQEIVHQHSETIILYTDGILEARLPDGVFFGEEHFIDLLSANAQMSLVELCDSGLATVKTYQANKLSDDVTMDVGAS